MQAIGPATAPDGLPIPGDIQVDAALTLANGRNVFLSALDFANYREVGLDLWGTQGRLAVWQEGLVLSHFPRTANRAMSGEREVASDTPAPITSTVGEAFRHLYDNLAAALDAGAPLASPGASALISERVIEDIVQSVRTGTRRTLTP